MILPDSRIELLAQPPHGLQIRMNEQEHSDVIKRWATNLGVECDQSAYEFLWYKTQGHAGVLKNMLEFMKSKAPTMVRVFLIHLVTLLIESQFASHGESKISYDAAQCRRILGEDFLPAMCPGARDYWDKETKADYMEGVARYIEADPKFSWLTLADIDDALFAAATQLKGAWIGDDDETINQNGSTALKLLAAQRLGLLRSVKHKDWTQCTFASPFHQRYKFRLYFSYNI